MVPVQQFISMLDHEVVSLKHRGVGPIGGRAIFEWWQHVLSGAARLYCPEQLDSLLARDETLDAFDAAQRISSHRQRWEAHLDKHFALTSSDAL